MLRKVQLAQLDIAKEIKRVCAENEIEYWLDSGTLLGAIRHKGFIPWDDDLDLGMKREHYERFLRIAPQKLGPEYYLQTWESDNEYGFPFAKVRKNGTVYIESKAQNSKAHNGIYVDIFPYDGYGADRKQGLGIDIIKIIMRNKSHVYTWKQAGRTDYTKLIKNIPALLISPFLSRRKLIDKYQELATLFNDKPFDYYFPQGISAYGKWIIPCSAVEGMIEVPFEDTTFTAPKGFSDYLTYAYGDYMQLPPEDRRENRHQIIEVKL